jgi:hypothetical protein
MKKGEWNTATFKKYHPSKTRNDVQVYIVKNLDKKNEEWHEIPEWKSKKRMMKGGKVVRYGGQGNKYLLWTVGRTSPRERPREQAKKIAGTGPQGSMRGRPRLSKPMTEEERAEEKRKLEILRKQGIIKNGGKVSHRPRQYYSMFNDTAIRRLG